MGNPVLHFEIVHKDAESLKGFYGNVFDWQIDSDNEMNYGMATTRPDSEPGINGGISGTMDPSQPGYVTFYIQVDDINETLKKIESLGGKTVMERTEIPNVVTFAQFIDPGGNMVGLVEPMPDAQ